MAAPNLASSTVRVQLGRTAHEISLPSNDMTCAALRRACAHLCPPQQACFLAKGKKLSDEQSLDGVSKVTLLKKPATAVALEEKKKIKLTLRDFVSERIVRDVDLDLSTPITELVETAKKALRVPPTLQRPRRD